MRKDLLLLIASMILILLLMLLQYMTSMILTFSPRDPNMIITLLMIIRYVNDIYNSHLAPHDPTAHDLYDPQLAHDPKISMVLLMILQ
jgi:hypothetical protein